MKNFIIIILSINSLLINGQTCGTFYFSKRNKICNEKDAYYKHSITKTNKNTYIDYIFNKIEDKWDNELFKNFEKLIFKHDSIIFIESYIDDKISIKTKITYRRINDSLFYFKNYNKENIVVQQGTASNILPLILNGKIENFYENNKLKSIEIYQNNVLLSNQRWKENGETDLPNVFNFKLVDKEPKLINDEKDIFNFIIENVKYPDEAKETGIQGRVVVEMVILEDGSICNLNVLNRVNTLLDNESIRVVSLTNKKWTPGEIDNKSVKTYVCIPFNFKLK